MSAEGNREQLRLGFLTAIEIPQRGYVGGLLVTNHLGRPLEFQCTTPVQPNRTQEILYGPTLVPFILGELIGRTLVEKVGVTPDLLLTDSVDLLELREHVGIPVAWVEGVADRSADENALAETPAADTRQDDESETANEASAERSQESSEIPGISSAGLATAETACIESHVDPQPHEQEEASREPDPMSVGRQVLRFHDAHRADRAIVSQKSHLIPREADLLEPFERVREALKESTRTGAAR